MKKTELEAMIKYLQEKKKILAVDVDGLEQYSRMNCLVLHGAQEGAKENIVQVIIKAMSGELVLELQERDK